MLCLGIPTVCRYDLLAECLRSVMAGSQVPARMYVIDNGNGLGGELFDGDVQLISPPENLGVARSWNLLHELTWPHDLILANDDVTFQPDTIKAAAETPGPIVFMHGWACFLIRQECWEKVGHFDDRFFPAYFEDTDYHHRMRLVGIEGVSLPEEVGAKHVGSATLKGAEPIHRETIQRCFEDNKRRYVEKWGGVPGQERAASLIQV